MCGIFDFETCLKLLSNIWVSLKINILAIWPDIECFSWSPFSDRISPPTFWCSVWVVLPGVVLPWIAKNYQEFWCFWTVFGGAILVMLSGQKCRTLLNLSSYCCQRSLIFSCHKVLIFKSKNSVCLLLRTTSYNWASSVKILPLFSMLTSWITFGHAMPLLSGGGTALQLARSCHASFKMRMRFTQLLHCAMH